MDTTSIRDEDFDIVLDEFVKCFREVLPPPLPSHDENGYTTYESTMGTLRRVVREHAKLSFDNVTLRCLLQEALGDWEYATKYKGEYFDQKHGDSVRIAEMRKEIADMEAT